MKAVIVMYDTLNRHFLPSYGNDWVKAPNFERLAGKMAPHRVLAPRFANISRSKPRIEEE